MCKRKGVLSSSQAPSIDSCRFYKNISPLSPVLQPFTNDYDSHKRLVAEEPLLCCTILMIASRHYHLPGAGGAMRADFIHNRVWKHIEYLLQRITLGAEKYSVAKSRTIGSIQALLLITDWHPRSIHSPPENDGWDASLAPSVNETFTLATQDNQAVRRWREDVFEPAKRSDRLSWMLVGMAITLAHELGILKRNDSEQHNENAAKDSPARIRRLLYVYSTQLSLRLGCSTIFPQDILLDVLQPVPTTRVQKEDQVLLSRWLELTKMLSTVADMFFESPATTKRLLRGNRYYAMLDHFKPLLDKWYQDFRLEYGRLVKAISSIRIRHD
jgi:hypothetical protein